MRRVQEQVAATTYTAIANSAGVDLSHVSHIMAGNRTPSLLVARKIAQHLGVSLDLLVDYLDTLKQQPVAA